MKYVMLYADGVADVPRRELNGNTLLQAASTPHLDRIASTGETGLLHLATENGQQGSELISVALLGHDPRKDYPGPGPMEAASLGVALDEHDVVYCCTMVTLRSEAHPEGASPFLDVKKLGLQVVMDDATAGLIGTEDARELLDAVNEQLGSETIQFYPGSGHRHLMVWVGGKARAVCLDPHQVVGRSIAEALPTGDGSDVLRKIMEAAFLILRTHPLNDEREAAGERPANCLWLWGQGRAPSWPPLSERYPISGAVVSTSDLHRGIGLSAGLEVAELDLEAGSEGAEFHRQRDAALRELSKKDFVYLHAGLADAVMHGSDVKAKVDTIERFDRELVGPIVAALESYAGARLLVVAGPGVTVGERTGAIPILYAFREGAGRTKIASDSRRFTERDAQASDGPPRDATKLIGRLFKGA